MNYNEMNQFILKYLTNDQTERAIMLSGEWGSGKSFYIKNTLKPFLERKEKGKDKYTCIIVSLYGLSDVSEISKAIYTELRSFKFKKKHEALTTVGVAASIVPKTVFNAMINQVGYDIGQVSEKQMQKVYDSIDLNKKLLVLEDIERTKIDILELLGYINNMCENDGVKILLVTNENELLSYDEIIDEDGNKELHYTDAAQAYLRVKEKTIGDTICFACDYITAIQQIISCFTLLNQYKTPEVADEIYKKCITKNSFNLRSFLYGCQKFNDIIEHITKNQLIIPKEIEKRAFYGIIAFTQRNRIESEMHFEDGTRFSVSLGLNEEYPLFRFCYDYIIEQAISSNNIKEETKYFQEYLEDLKKGEWNSGNDLDLQTIKTYIQKREDEVLVSISNIESKISRGVIPYCDYGVLINYLVALKYDLELDFELEGILLKIYDSLRSINKTTIKMETLLDLRHPLKSIEAKNKMNAIQQQLIAAIESARNLAFSYNPDDIPIYMQKYKTGLKDTLQTIGFAHTLDVNEFADMLEKCTSAQIELIRSLFTDLYCDGGITRELGHDNTILYAIKDKVGELCHSGKFDKIQKYNMILFKSELERIIKLTA